MLAYGNKTYLLEKFHIQPEEWKKISLLFFYSFFLGIFIAFYFAPANSEFIEHFGSQQLPYAYILAGIVGYLSTSLYSYLQKRGHTKWLFIGALLFMFVITLFSRVSLYFLEINKVDVGPFVFKKYERAISFFVFIWAWPFISMVNIVSGGLSLKLLNLMQVKRFFGLINIGGVIASILGYFAIPFLLRILHHHFDLLVIGLSGIVISFILILRIYKEFPEKHIVGSDEKEEEIHQNTFVLMKNKFLFLIFLSAILSMIVIYIADFGFLASIKAQPHLFVEKEKVTEFMAWVYGGLKIGELIMSLISSRALSKGGVKLGLTILPITTCFLLFLAAITGLSVGIGSLLFLGLMTLNKSFERMLRRGMDDPAFNVLYHTMPENQKLMIQTRVGVVMQLSIAIAGLFLLFVDFLLTGKFGFELKYFAIIVLPVLILWVIVSFNLYKAYKEKIKQILADKRLFKFNYNDSEIYGSQVLEKYLLSEDTSSTKLSVVILSETNPRSLEPYAHLLLKTDDIIIRKAILKNIDPTYSEDIIQVIEDIGNKFGFKEKELRKLILQSLYNLDYSELINISTDQIISLLTSLNTKDKIKLAKYLYRHPIENDEQIILQLLDHPDKQVKMAAIKIAGKRKSKILYKKLVDLLKYSEYSHVLGNILIEIGVDILPDLEARYRSETSLVILLKIIEIYAKIGTDESVIILLSHLNYPNRDIQSAVIHALNYCEYMATESTKPLIKQKIYDIADNILWIFASIKDLETRKNTLRIIQSLELEKERTFELLFHLLSFIYQPEIIDLIKTNLIGKNIIFALEIIDNFISQDVKYIIIPLFDKISVKQRIKKLSPYFKQEEMGFEARLKDIILRDYRKVDNWTKTKAIELLARYKKPTENYENKGFEIKDYKEGDIWTEADARRILKYVGKNELPDEIYVSLFNPDELVYSTAAQVIFEESPIRAITYLKSLSPEKQKLIDVLTMKDNAGVLMERVKLLKRIFLFYSVPENSLVKLARLVHAVRKRKDEPVYFINKHNNEDIMIVMKGQLNYTDENGREYRFFKNDIIIKGLNIPVEVEFVTTVKDSYVILINRFEYFNLLILEKDIIKHMFDRMKF